MKVELIVELPSPPKRIAEGHPPVKKIGTIVAHPKAYRLVQLGMAVPADKECAEKCLPFIGRMDELIFAGKRRERAIHMDDFQAYEQGLMIGYKPDGKRHDTWIHGPNWSEGCERAYYESQDEEEDDDDE